MRRLTTALATGVAMLLLVPTTGTAATAAAGYVSIGTIATKTAPPGGSVRVKPSAKAHGNVTIRTVRMTVRKGKHVIRRDVASARLKPGRYVVTTTAKYRPFTLVTTNQKVTAEGDRVLSVPTHATDPRLTLCTATAVTAIDTPTQGRADMDCEVKGVGKDANGRDLPSGHFVVRVPWEKTGDTYTIDFQEGESIVTTSVLQDGTVVHPTSLITNQEIHVSRTVRVLGALKKKVRTQKLLVKKG